VLVLKSAFRYFLQLILSYPAAYIAGMPISAFLFNGGEVPGIHFAGYEALACLFVSPLIGWIVGRYAPSFIPTGLWIWVLPVAAVLPGLLWERAHPRPVPWLPDYLFATSSNEGLGVYLLTLPCCAAIGYSLGMLLFSLIRRGSGASRSNFAFRVGTLFAAAAIVFSLLAKDLREFERVSLERWGRVGFVISDGLQVSPDAKLLCQEYTPQRSLPLLPRGTAVERLELLACSGNEVVDAHTPPPRGKDRYSLIAVERIRVLGGSDAGLEGWVLLSGLFKYR
jgi:hypothetical protein